MQRGNGLMAVGSWLVALAMLAAVTPQAQAADLTLAANAYLNGSGQLISTADSSVLLTATSGTGTQADPYIFDVAGDLNMGSYTIRGNTSNDTDDQYSATWRVTGSVTGSGNFDSYIDTTWSKHGGHVRIEAGGGIALNRVVTKTRYSTPTVAGDVYLWAKGGSVTLAAYIDARGCGDNSGTVTIRSEGPVSGQGITIAGTFTLDDSTVNSISASAFGDYGVTFPAKFAGNVSLYCQTNITLAGGISTRGGGVAYGSTSSGQIQIRGSATDASARAGAVVVGSSSGLRTDSLPTYFGGGNVTVKAVSLRVDGTINTQGSCYQDRTGNVDIDVLESATIGGVIDTSITYSGLSQGSPGYVKIVGRHIAVLGKDGSGNSIRTWQTVSASSSASSPGDADVTLSNVDTSAEIYDPVNPTNSLTSSIVVAGKIVTGRWYSDNAMGNVRISAVEVQLGGDVINGSTTASSIMAIHYGVTTYGVITHLVEGTPGIRWNGSSGHNITYTVSPGTLSFTADVPYGGKLAVAVPASIQNRPATNVTTTAATFRGFLPSAGDPAAAVSVLWGETTGATVSAWSNTNSWNAGDWADDTYPSTNLSLTANRNYYYTFVASNAAGTVVADSPQYLITGELTPLATDASCGTTMANTGTIQVSRPDTCADGPLTVNYALSGASAYVSVNPASGFVLAAGQASTNITIQPVRPNLGGPVDVVVTLLPGAYPSDNLAAAACSVATATAYSLTAASDTQVGNALDVVENPPDIVGVTVAGSLYMYDFWTSSLDLNGKRIYCQVAGTPRNLSLTNLAALTDGGTGWIDNSAPPFYAGGAIGIYAPGGVRLNGTNAAGYALDGSCTGPIGAAAHGGAVTVVTTGGVTLAAGGIRTQGDVGNNIWITDGAGGSAGNVTIGGSLMALSLGRNELGYSGIEGTVIVRGGAVSIGGNVDTHCTADYGTGKSITIVASGPLIVDGCLASMSTALGSSWNGGAVSLAGTTITVNGALNGMSIASKCVADYAGGKAGDITVTATAGSIALAGGLDASQPTLASRGVIALAATNGSISVGSLDANLCKTISLQAGTNRFDFIYVTGVLTNFAVNESPKTFTFPAGSVVGNDIYYLSASNTVIPLSGTYEIFVAASDTGKVLKEGPPPKSVPGTVILIR